MRYAIAVLILLSCTDPERTRQTLEAQGFTDIRIGGHAWNSCGHGDDYCTSFEATGPTGRRVHGAVGCGAGCGKGCTVRIEP